MEDKDVEFLDGGSQPAGDEQGEPTPPSMATIPWTELPHDAAGPLAQEWNFYRREVGRLLSEGLEGKWVLVKGESIMGILGTAAEAKAMALQEYLQEPCLIHQIARHEPVLRGPSRNWLCPG